MNIDLLRLKGASVKEMQNGEKCIVVPVKENDVFLSDRGGAYLSLTAIQKREITYGQTHIIRRKVAYDVYKNLTKEEQRAIPILGALTPSESNNDYSQTTSDNSRVSNGGSHFSNNSQADADNLPF